MAQSNERKGRVVRIHRTIGVAHVLDEGDGQQRIYRLLDRQAVSGFHQGDRVLFQIDARGDVKTMRLRWPPPAA